MRPPSRTTLFTVLTVTAAAMLADPAGGASEQLELGGGGWTPSVALSQPMDAIRVASGAPASAAVNPHGTAFAVWATHHAVRIAHRPPGGPWSSRVLHASEAKPPSRPAIDVNQAGDQVAAWIQGHTVRAMRRSSGGGWGPAVRLEKLPGHQSVISDLTLVVGPDGTTLVTYWRGWVRRCPGTGEDCNIDNVRGVATVRPAGGRWTRLRSFAGPYDSVWGYQNPYLMPGKALVASPAGVVSNQGTMTLGWVKPGYMQSGPVFVRSRAPGSTWGPRQRLTSRDANAVGPVLTATTWGQVTAAWSARRHDRDIVQSRTRLGAAPWGPVQRVFGRGFVAGLGVDGTGAVTALLTRENRPHWRGGTFIMTRPRWGTWGGRVRIGPGGQGPELAVDSTGEAVAAWKNSTTIFASYHDSSEPWTKAVTIGTEAGPMTSVAMGEDDTAVVLWYRTAGPRDGKVVLKASAHPS